MVRMVQCLCPLRHAIMGVAYEPGVTAASTESGDDITMTPETARGWMQDIVRLFLQNRSINPWCGLCGAKLETWTYEDRVTIFATMEEAEPAIRQSEREQAFARSILGNRSQQARQN